MFIGLPFEGSTHVLRLTLLGATLVFFGCSAPSSSGGAGGGAADGGGVVGSGSGAAGGSGGGGAAGGAGGGSTSDAGYLITVGVGGDRRYFTVDGNVTIQGDVQDKSPSDPDWADGHTDAMIRGLCYGAGRFLAVGGQGDATFRSTRDGASWTTLTTLDGMGGRPKASWFGGCAYGGGRFVAAGGNGARCWSANALSWTCPGMSMDFHHRAVAYGGGRFVTVGNSYASPAAHVSSVSSDGVVWTEIPALMNRPANDIIYVASHGRFYAAFGDLLGSLSDGQATWQPVQGVDVSGQAGMTEKNGTLYLGGLRPMPPYTRFLVSSSNGTQWATATPTSSFEGMHYDQRNHFIALRYQYPSPPTPNRKSSSDAVTWTEVAESNAQHGVGRFVTGPIWP